MMNGIAPENMGPAAADDRLERRVLQVCDAAGSFIEYWGFKAIHGRIWTVLALRREPMSQIEICELLGVSRSLVSTSVAQLVDFGLVRPVSEHRMAPYEAVIDVWPTITEILRSREWMILESARNTLEAALEEAQLQQESGHSSAYNHDRIQMLLTMTEMAQSFLKILLGIRVPKSVTGIGHWVNRARQVVDSFRTLS
ncbi:MAG TPA: ArsR family transcriptional regulator [Myxococcales bacterium]|nr:ArsR family transcriptional regulator [Myxococcales bacterium]HIN85108.1 ArsR family transcriptional regulator [Myxococcales bacterium]